MARYVEEYTAIVLRRLMEDKPLDEIKVNEIIRVGQINRKTFYYHFHGIEDLLRWMLSRMFSELDLGEADHMNWKGKTETLLRKIEENKGFFIAIYVSRYAADIAAYENAKLYRHFDVFVRNCIRACRSKNSSAGLTETQIEYITNYYLQGVMSLVDKWISGGCAEQAAEFIDIVDNLTKNTIFNVIEAFSEQNSHEKCAYPFAAQGRSLCTDRCGQKERADSSALSNKTVL